MATFIITARANLCLIVCLLGFNIALTSEVIILRQCLLVVIVLWPMCCNTGMSSCRHRAWHPTLSQYTDTGHDTPPRHSIQTQGMTPHLVTVYRHRAWHPTSSQYTDTGHDTPPCHSIQTQGMTPHLVTVYRHRAWHPTSSQYTDTGHDTPPCHSIQTQGMTPHLVTVYRHRAWHPTLSQYTDTGHDTPPRHSIQTQGMPLPLVTVYRHRADLLCYPLMWLTHWNTQLPILMSWVRLLPKPFTYTNAQCYDADMVVVSQKLSRMCTVHAESWTRGKLTWYLWYANPLG